MPTCIVPGCTSGKKSNPRKFHFFTIPKNPVIAELWRTLIKRNDISVTSRATVCENHFKKEEILWQRSMLGPDGAVLGVGQYKVPRLKEGSVPSLFPWTEVEPSFHSECQGVLMEMEQNKECFSFAASETNRTSSMSANSKRENYYIGTVPLSSHTKRQKLSTEDSENEILPTDGGQNQGASFGTVSELCQSETKNNVTIHLRDRKFSTDGQQKGIPAPELNVDTEDQLVVGTLNNTVVKVAPVNSSLENSKDFSPLITFAELSTAELSLPPGWHIDKMAGDQKNLIMICTLEVVKMDRILTPLVLKALFVKKDMSIEISVLSRILNLERLDMPNRIDNVEHLQNLLFTIHNLKVCAGCTGPTVDREMSRQVYNKLGKDVSGVWRHNMCGLLLENATICRFCQTARKTLATRSRRWKASQGKKSRPSIPATSVEQKKRWTQLRSQYRCAVRDKKRAQMKTRHLKAELLECREKTAHLKNFDFEEHLASGNISQNQVHVLKQIIDAAKHKSPKGRNYSEEWMLLCMLLHMRSPCGYEFLRSNEILPLPCIRTIRRCLSKIKSKCGFDEKFFQLFKLALEKKTELQRHGILLFDEMATRESVAVDTKNLTYKGLVDFGNEGPSSSDFSERANHGLVFMFQPLNDNYTQPIAVFASRGPVKGAVLAELIVKAIVLLENSGAKIHAVISDGASTNRKFWSEVGVNGARNSFRNYFEHPSVEGRKIFVFSDTPHLIKTIRNRLFNNHVLQMDPAESEIKWQYIEKLQEMDRKLAGPGQVLVCPKLTPNHVFLNNAMKMRVRLATQVFSNSVAGGLRFFQTRVPEFADSEATATFCKWMNDLFDALNRKNEIDGVRPNNLDFRIIQDSLQKLNLWEQKVITGKLSKDLFLTTQTAEGLRVTLQSTLDLVKYLTEHCGFKYVLTGRLNQDPLEKFFGTVRQAGGCNDHPSTPTFLNIYKILSTFSILKPPKTGNCSVTINKPHEPLITLSELNAIYDTPQKSIHLSQSMNLLKTRLERIVEHDDWQLEDFIEHDYCSPAVDDCALYCLTADLTKRVLQTVKCSTCKEALIRHEAEDVILPEAKLAHWQQRPNLIHPNTHLYRFVVFLENCFEKHCQSTNVLEEMLTEVCQYDRHCFPCALHAADIVTNIVHYFITMRMQQYCTRLNADQQKINRLKKKTSKFCKT